MAQKKKAEGVDGYKVIADSLKAGQVGNFYIFHGDERYLLERSLGALRKFLCPDGLDSFNYKRFGGGVRVSELDDAVNTLPAFAERTLVELHDFDIFKDGNKQQLTEIINDLPDYICIVLIYDTIPYKPDGRQKLDKDILKNAEVIEFSLSKQAELVKWIIRHFKDAGKTIARADAEYLALITGGYMTTLYGEIGKVAAYAAYEAVSRSDIDAVVIPELDAVVYKLTDALIQGKHADAMSILDELLRMREAPHKLIFNISLKMRQLLAARVCIENNSNRYDLMDMCGIRYDFQARTLMDTARGTTLSKCREAVLHCSDAAFDLNSAPEPEARLVELIARLAHLK